MQFFFFPFANFCPVSCYFLSLRPKCFTQHPILELPLQFPFIYVRDRFSPMCKTTGKIVVLCTFNAFIFGCETEINLSLISVVNTENRDRVSTSGLDLRNFRID
jgi:hypothetical protein